MPSQPNCQLRAVCMLTLVSESIDGHSLHVRPLHARSLCVNLIDESRVLAKQTVDPFECVEKSGCGNTIAITQLQDHVLPLLKPREDRHCEDSGVRELSGKSRRNVRIEQTHELFGAGWGLGELDGWTATLVYLGTIIVGLRQIAFGSQVNVQLADTRIEMLLLVVTCAERGDMWNKTTASGRKVVLDASSSPL